MPLPAECPVGDGGEERRGFGGLADVDGMVASGGCPLRDKPNWVATTCCRLEEANGMTVLDALNYKSSVVYIDMVFVFRYFDEI